MQELKFDESERTFETRLLFLKSIYEDKHDNIDIMKKCIEHKLNRSLDFYLKELTNSYNNLGAENSIKVLRRIK